MYRIEKAHSLEIVSTGQTPLFISGARARTPCPKLPTVVRFRGPTCLSGIPLLPHSGLLDGNPFQSLLERVLETTAIFLGFGPKVELSLWVMFPTSVNCSIDYKTITNQLRTLPFVHSMNELAHPNAHPHS
jgi:hypothetical protein